MAGIPREVQQWALVTTRGEFIRFMNDLSVPESILQPYIVKKTEAILPSITESSENSTTEEPMELDNPATSTSSIENASINLSEGDGDPLPSVVIGSESWHNQVPAVRITQFERLIFNFYFKFRNGFLLLLEIHRDKDDKIHNHRLVMRIFPACRAKGGKLSQAPNHKEVCRKLSQVNLIHLILRC